MAELNYAEKMNIGYENEYSTDAMTGGPDKRRQLYYQLIQSMKKAESVDIIVSFLMESGVRMLLKELEHTLKRGAKIRILTGNYLGITQPSALYLIKRKLGDRVDLRFYCEKGRSFHPKSYIFHYTDYSELYIGSSNISRSALTSGIEWNYRFSSQKDPENYKEFFTSQNLTYLKMSFNSVLYAGIVTLVTLLISYPTAYFLTLLKHRQLWLMLIVLPTWVNLLLKAYAFIGIFGQNGSINSFLSFLGVAPQQILFTDFSFIFVASYIELPFMILPIFNVLDDLDPNLINASYDLGANRWDTFRHVVFPLSMNGVRSGVQSVFIPSLSLFMLTRMIGGNRVITLGTAIEQHFLTTQNWGMGSTIGVVLILAMLLTMWATRERRER